MENMIGGVDFEAWTALFLISFIITSGYFISKICFSLIEGIIIGILNSFKNKFGKERR